MPNFAIFVGVGHLGQDIEIKHMPDGTPVGRFSLAVSTGYKDKKVTSWYRVSLWGKQAESLQPYLTKGKAVLVTGEPSINEWNDNEGRKRTSVEIRAKEIKLMGDRPESNGAPANAPADADPSQSEIPF